MKTFRPLMTVLLLVYCLGAPVAAFWLGGHVFECRRAAIDSRAQSRFAQIRCALLIYHDKYGAFPPLRYQAEPDGPVHSWRVLLLPHTEGGEQYHKYDFGQEWNSRTNLDAVAHYSSLFSTTETDNTTVAHYLAVGESNDWPFRKAMKARLVTSGNDRFLVVEDPDSQIPWMEPKY